ncbi:MAG: TIGR03668 family PPOX class F420-dependent oxidoreductase [Actinobacteria bacterium]|nr:TIGR03668 family PPOX class F420-dependent oxidoreductase [Actinomycetota bacterium]
MRRLAEGARVARLATTAADGQIRIVPCAFALVGAAVDDVVYSAVDHKPKQTRELARLRDIEERPAVALLIDHYEDDWTQLWWVRLQGRGRVLRAGDERELAVARLTTKYPQYQAQHLDGPVIAVDVDTWRGWSARG